MNKYKKLRVTSDHCPRYLYCLGCGKPFVAPLMCQDYCSVECFQPAPEDSMTRYDKWMYEVWGLGEGYIQNWERKFGSVLNKIYTQKSIDDMDYTANYRPYFTLFGDGELLWW